MRISRFFGATSILTLAIGAVLSTASADAADTAAIGAASGTAFRAECPEGSYIQGFDFKTGQRIGAITPLCAPFNGTDRLGVAAPQQSYGSAAAANKNQNALCAPDKIVAGLKVHQANRNPVNAIEVTCRAIADSTVQTLCIATGEGCQGEAIACATGEAAIGIHGRASKALDAIGLVCGPVLARAETPPQSAGAGAEPPQESAEFEPPPPPAPVTKPTPAFTAPPPSRGLGPPAAGAPPPSRDAAQAPPSPAAAQAPRAPPKMAPAPVPVKSAPSPGAAPAEKEKFSMVPVFYGTDRTPTPSLKRLSYSADRARKLEVGRALVTVPTNHQVPNVERPWALTVPFTSITLYEEAEDPAKHFTMREIKALSQVDFLKLVGERLKSSKSFKDQALIFIHGYNTSFDNAIYRTAQIAHDLKFDGAPFLYSWPSKGELASYTYDRASNEQSEPFLKEYIELVARKSGAKSISVIAHSMGNQLTLRVLKEISQLRPKIAINQIILAAPDVDRDSFENIVRGLKGMAKGITLYAAANDRALQASMSFHGGVPRAGDVPATGPVVMDGLDTIDVTTLSTDSLGLNHSLYAERNTLLDDIAKLVLNGLRPPMKRTPALTSVKASKGEYWKFPAQ